MHRVYYIPADIVWGTWIAAGLALILHHSGEVSRYLIRFLALAGVIGIVVANWSYGNRRNDWIADRVGRDILRSMAPNSRILPIDDLIYAILYLTKVEGYRSDVQITGSHFGYQIRGNEGFLYAMSPVTPAWEEFLSSELAQAGNLPEGLVYRLTPKKTTIVDYGRFKTLDPPPAVPAAMIDPDDVMDRYARARSVCVLQSPGGQRVCCGEKRRCEYRLGHGRVLGPKFLFLI